MLTSFFATNSDESVINAEVLMTEFIIQHSLLLSVADYCGKLLERCSLTLRLRRSTHVGRLVFKTERNGNLHVTCTFDMV